LSPSEKANDREPDPRGARRRAFFDAANDSEEVSMANHLTPDELAKEMGMDREEVIRICVAEGVPIYHGKIDKTLFQASLEAVGTGSAART
jgi:hypothetical protein